MPDGRLLFVDELNSRLLVQDGSGLRIVPADLRYPKSATILGSKAFVADSWHHRVLAFSLPALKVDFEFTGFFCPSWIEVMNGMLVVADTNNCRLSFHNVDGSCAFTYALDGFPKRVHFHDGCLIVHYDNGEVERLDY
jgi:hypothetical protein